MKRRWCFLGLILLGLLLFNLNFLSADLIPFHIYIANASVGSDSGYDCANAHSLAWFNTVSNWNGALNGTDNKIGYNDTVHLCGTFNSGANGRLLIVQASGSFANPIKIIFENDTILQAPYFENYYGAIRIIDGLSNIKVDGGINGIIQHTDSGSSASGKTYNVSTMGMYVAGTRNVEISNLTIKNIFINTGGNLSNATDISGLNTFGLYVNHNNTNLSIHNCNFSNARAPLYFKFDSSTLDNVTIYNNTIRDAPWSIAIGSGSANSRIINLDIYNNDISDWSLWQYPSVTYHTDGLIIFVNTPDFNASYYTGKFHNNYFHGDLGAGSATAYLSVGCGGKNFSVYNNVFKSENPSIAGSDVAIWISGSCAGYTANNPVNTSIYNNVFFGANSFLNLGNYAMVMGSTADVKNNIFSNYYVAYRNDVNFTANYNFYNTSYIASSPLNFSQWQSLGQDNNSLIGDPLFVNSTSSNFHLKNNSLAIDSGVNLSGIVDYDYEGNSRPNGSGWDIGAYESNYSDGSLNTNKVELLNVNGSINATYTNITACANVVSAGQTCLVYNGTYQETVSVAHSGNLTNPIFFIGLGNVLIDGSNQDRAFLIDNKDYISLENLTIANNNHTYRSVLEIRDAKNITVKNCEIFNASTFNVLYVLRSSFVLIENNSIHSSLENDSYGSLIAFENSNYSFIRNNSVFDTSATLADAIKIYNCSDNVIESNDVYGPAENGIYIRPGSRNIIRYNYIHNISGIGTQLRDGARNNSVYYNVYMYNGGPVIQSDGKNGAGASGNKIYNNFIYNTGDSGGIHIFAVVGENYGTEVKNNLVITQNQQNIQVDIDSRNSGAIVDYNCYYKYGASDAPYLADDEVWTPYYNLTSWRSATGLDLHSIEVNPNITQMPPIIMLDAMLQNNSPCVDAGTNVGFSYLGNAPDIGAYESNYSGVTCNTNLINDSTDWINVSCLSSNLMNQTRNRIEYDNNSCNLISNVTYVDYRQTESCTYVAPCTSNCGSRGGGGGGSTPPVVNNTNKTNVTAILIPVINDSFINKSSTNLNNDSKDEDLFKEQVELNAPVPVSGFFENLLGTVKEIKLWIIIVVAGLVVIIIFTVTLLIFKKNKKKYSRR